jgi:hypothetical protein
MRKLGTIPLFLLLALAGCDQFRATERERLALLGPSCPPSGVLADALAVSKLKPGLPVTGIQDPAMVVYSAEMARPVLECDFDREANTLSVDLAITFRATRGPAEAPEPPLEFFVSIIDLEENVLVKNVYRYQPNIGVNRAVQWTQNVRDLVVPMQPDTRPGDYEILIGFQLTPDELAYSRLPKTEPVASR